MLPPILLIAIGNESRGDDALAPLLLRRLQQDIADERIEFLEDFQLQVEHAADLKGRDRVLFIDAGMDTPAPFAFYQTRPDRGHPLFSHAITPEAVMATYRQVYGEEPPPCFVLCLRGEQFELGSPISEAAQQHLDAAHAFVSKLIQDQSPEHWSACSGKAQLC